MKEKLEINPGVNYYEDFLPSPASQKLSAKNSSILIEKYVNKVIELI